MGELLNPILSNPAVKLTEQLCGLFLFVLYFAVVFWTYRDANRRGAMGWFWALVTLLFFPFFPYPGLVVYLVVRPSETVDDAHERELMIRQTEAALQTQGGTCPACLKPVEKDFLICPYCMKKLKKTCVECDRPLKLNWNVCPYCRTKQ